MVKKHCHSLELVLSGVKQHHVLALEIWGENAVADGVDDFSAAPEAAAVEFVAWCGSAAYGGAVSVYKFALALAFKYVAAQEPRLEILQSQFLAGLAPQRFNYRLTDIQAALGISQLSRAAEGLARRQEIARRYDEAFAGHTDIRIPSRAGDVYHAFHLYVIQVPDRKGLYDFLRANRVMAQVHYAPLHLMPYYKNLGNREGDLPVAEEYYRHCLSLPMFPALTEEEQDYVIEKVLEFIERV